MKILLIGNINSIWVRLYIEKVLLKIKDVKIYILSFKNINADNKKYFKQYKHKINIFENTQGKYLKAVKAYLWCKHNSRDGKFDFLHIHYMPNVVVSFLCKVLCSKYANNVILTYYGSDLFDKSAIKKYAHAMLIKSAKYVTMATNNMIKTFNDIYKFKFENKVRKIAFGLETISEIDKIFEEADSVKKCKEKYGIDVNKKSIAIGYNGRETQRHIDIIDEIIKLDETERSNLCLIVHLGYNLSSDEYRKKIIKKLDESKTDYVVIDDFLDKKELAELRVATDIIIHAQPSDAFSASIQEVIYAEGILINPIWIVYEELDEENVKYYKFSEIKEIHETLRLCRLTKEEKIKNRDAIKRLSSWEYNCKLWNDLYIGVN
ncbi:MAG: hypothetical protein ACLSAO_00075 [Anaerovoracaceae bacterium]